MIHQNEQQVLQAKVDQYRRLSTEANDPTTAARLLARIKELEQQQLDSAK